MSVMNEYANDDESYYIEFTERLTNGKEIKVRYRTREDYELATEIHKRIEDLANKLKLGNV